MDGELKLDAKMVDTKLAKSYLEKHKEFHSLGYKRDLDCDDYIVDSYGNKIICLDNEDIFPRAFPVSSVSTKLRKQMCDLAKKIEENAELFSQLEYLIRKTPKDEVKFCDIKLILQNLLYCSSCCMPKHFYDCNLSMTETAPLANLGFAAQILMANRTVVILPCAETAVVCYLFTQLCHQVGLDGVKLKMPSAKGLTINRFAHDKIEEFQSAGLGIVTERSDADSAVDAFLDSSTRLPWKLRRILIQESVYESVKKIFAWKCKNNTVEAAMNDKDSTLKSLCSEIYVHEGKLYLFDYAGDCQQILDSKNQVVLIEAYRTTKELLSLLKTQKPYCISLWCSDISETNEISFGADVHVVWVNDFGVFDGPPRSSQSYYSTIEFYATESDNVYNEKHAEQTIWKNLSLEKRIEKIIKCLEKYTIENKDQAKDLVDMIEEDILNWKSDSFVDIQKGRFCIGTVVPVDFVSYYNHEEDYVLQNIIASMMNGQGVLVQQNGSLKLSQEKNKTFLEFLEKEGFPISVIDVKLFGKGPQIKLGLNLSHTKVVWTNFGTIFAN